MNLKNIISIMVCAGTMLITNSCTDLSETVYSQVMSDNYYNTKQDVIQAVFRPFEHTYCYTYDIFEREELTGDQFMTPTRGTWWYDSGKWEALHRHSWTDISTGWPWTSDWNSCYTGIGQCNLVLDDLAKLSPSKFGLTDAEFDNFKGQLRCARAYLYLRLLNLYRNCVLTTTSDANENEKAENRKQVEPKVLFTYIENELLDCIKTLDIKQGENGPNNMQGSYTKGAAATLLVRLYLNAEKWIGEAKYSECYDICNEIIKGDYGSYSLAKNWWEPFDWNNETCNEVIFGFPGSFSGTSWHMQNTYRTCYGRTLPFGCEYYLDIQGNGSRNPKYALTPSYDNKTPRKLFDYKLGMVTQKFMKYSGDLRFKQYKNTSVNSREGMFFLEGKIPNSNIAGGYAKEPSGQYVLYLRDQCGQFLKTAEEDIISGSGAESKMGNGDFNSGLYAVKYPFYSYTGGYYIESDLTVMRLAEIYYSAAECKLRLGDASTAGKLLNAVRKRNYESFDATIAYEPEGSVKLDMDEMLDEWGREFLQEGRRRTDLIRFGRFEEAWWDKPKDADSHCELFPIPQQALQQNNLLRQNPGYNDIKR